MTLLCHNRIIRVIAIALTLFGFSAFAVSGVSAQTITGTPAGGDSDIVITARVLGCGDGVVQTGLGEQCDGSNLNTQSCASIGFDSGTLSCRTSCIFETSACTNDDTDGPGSVRDVTGIFDTDVPDTNVVFTGRGEPGSTFFVVTSDGYFTSVTVGNDGYFTTTVSEPTPGEYSFTFYTLSSNGLFGPEIFSTPIAQYATTYINNIFIPYNILEPIIPEEPLIPITELEPLTPIEQPTEEITNQNDALSIDGDLFAEFLDVLSQNENLSPDELRELIKVFSEQNGYEAKVPGYTNNWWRDMQYTLSEQTNGLSEWYPNVYVSFMVPYWNIVYDFTDWFNEYKAPFWAYRFFL